MFHDKKKQIARAAAIFRVEEIVVYDDSASLPDEEARERAHQFSIAFVRILEYIECPQYLRKDFFQQEPVLQYVGALPPLATPHHVLATVKCRYREGVPRGGDASHVYVGLEKLARVDRQLQHESVRVTVEMLGECEEHYNARLVSPRAPYEEQGLYWGYTVRWADSLKSAIGGVESRYECVIGTSENGERAKKLKIARPARCLVVFGALAGLEPILAAEKLGEPSDAFHYYFNTCPSQGSNTIRTEVCGEKNTQVGKN